MRSVCVVVFSALALVACGSSSSSDPDGGGGDGDGGVDPTGDGGGSAGSHTVTLTLANRPNNGAQYSFFVAYQDGSAPWQVAPAPTGDDYRLSITAPSYGIAWGCTGTVGGTTTTQLRTITTAHFALSERTEVAFEVPARCTDRNAGNVTLSGTITNRPFSGVLVVWFGNRSAFVSNQTGGFSISTPPGTHDLIVTHSVPEGNGDFYDDEALVVRDVAVTASTTRTIDFSPAQSTEFYAVTASVPNPNARILAQTTLYTANGTTLPLVRESTNWESDALAEGQRRTTDVYDQAIAVTTLATGVTVTNATSTPGEQTYVAPAPLGAVATTVAAKMPYPILQTTWPAYPNTVGYAWNATQQLSAQQCNGNLACTVAWTSYVSPGTVGSMPAFRMPDLSDIMGWKSSYALVAGTQVVGGVTAQTSTAGEHDFPPGTPASGTQRAFVRADYGVTP